VTSDWMPHGLCLFWNPWLISAHVLGDSVIALAYFLIPVALWAARRKIQDALGRVVFLCFASFILLCGMTHVMDIAVLWVSWYKVQAAVKLVTACVSIGTALFVTRIVRAVL